MAFTAADVKKLREMTSVGMMDCKKALTEADGDFDKAIELLREKGLAKAAKKADRIAAEGLVKATVCDKCGVGAIIEVNSETDFVAKNADFQQFVSDLANVVIKDAPADVEALKACKMGEGTVQDALQEKVLTIGENLQIRRFVSFANSTNQNYLEYYLYQEHIQDCSSRNTEQCILFPFMQNENERQCDKFRYAMIYSAD